MDYVKLKPGSLNVLKFQERVRQTCRNSKNGLARTRAKPLNPITALSALLPPTLALNPFFYSSYHHPLPLTSSVTLTAIIHPGTPTHRKTNQEKICLTGSSLLIFYLLTIPNIIPYYTVRPETAPPLISLWFLPK